jgi:hypothetical protein
VRNYALVRVKRDPQTGRIVRGQLREINSERSKWLGEEFIMEAPAIARLILDGDHVISVFGSRPPDHMTLVGALLQPHTFEDGFVGITLISESEGRTADDFFPLE